MKHSIIARRALLGALLTGTTMFGTGCSSSPGGFSLASMNPFSSPSPSAEPGTISKVSDSIASTAGGARNQVSSMGSTVKSAWGKSTGAVTGLFNGGDSGSEQIDETDPLRLDNSPKSISPEVFVANGQLWESTGDHKKAMESYVKALESEPNNGPALTSVARLHFRKGDHPKAAEFFQKAIAASPEDAGLYNDLGLTLSKLGNHTLAAQSLERALQLAPGTSRYANNLASVKFESGDSDSAYQVLASSNKPAVAHFNMAYLHFKKGQVNEARGHLGQAMQFEAQSGEDTAVKRAVDRSRDMLAQLDGSTSPIAQAGPQASIAGLPNTTTIQQTSQSQTPGASLHVSPASPTGPATSQAASLPLPWATAPVAAPPAPTQNTAPQVSVPQVTVPQASVPQVTLPQASVPQPEVPQVTLPQTPAGQGPSIPFSLPTGFGQ